MECLKIAVISQQNSKALLNLYITFNGKPATRYLSKLIARMVKTEALAIVFSKNGTALPVKIVV